MDLHLVGHGSAGGRIYFCRYDIDFHNGLGPYWAD